MLRRPISLRGDALRDPVLTKYEYDADVVDNINALRVKPAANSRQRVDEFSVRLTPEVRQHRHDDYFGTEVVEFEVTRPHRELVVDVRARVTTQPQAEPPGTTWEGAARAGLPRGRRRVPAPDRRRPGPSAAGGAVSEVASRSDPAGAAMAVTELIPDRLRVPPGRDLRRLAADRRCWTAAPGSARTSSTSA